MTPLLMYSKCAWKPRLTIAVDEPLRSDAGQQLLHDAEPGSEQAKQNDDGQDECDDLVLRRRRDAGADREEPAGHQDAAEIRGDDDAVVGIAEIVDGDPDRERQRERDRRERPGRQELAGDGLPGLERQRHQQLDAAGFTLLGPQPHARAPARETGIATGASGKIADRSAWPRLVEAAVEEREHAGEHEEDHDEHVSDRRREIARELALEYGGDAAHAVAPPVIERNTSSRRPDSKCSSASGQRCRSASALIGASGSLPGRRERRDAAALLVELRARDLGHADRWHCATAATSSGFAQLQRHGVVEPRARLEPARRVVGENLAVRDDDRAAADGLHFLEQVRRDHDDLRLRHAPDELAHLVLLVRIEAVGRLVEDQHLGVVQDRLRETDAAPIALRQRVDGLLEHVLEVQQLEHLVEALLAARRGARPRASAMNSRNERGVISG